MGATTAAVVSFPGQIGMHMTLWRYGLPGLARFTLLGHAAYVFELVLLLCLFNQLLAHPPTRVWLAGTG
jgi:hypothetical protein